MKHGAKLIISFVVTGIILGGVVVFAFAVDLPVLPVAICVLFVAAGCGVFVSWMLSDPLRRLANGAEAVASGNLEYKVGVRGRDEVSAISRYVDKLAEDLRAAEEAIGERDHEISECRKVAGDLKENEEYYKRLFEESNDAVFIYDFDGKVIDVNKKACEMLEYSREELLKVSFMDLHTAEELTRSKEAYKTETETFSIRFESKFKRSDGSVINVEISSSVIDFKRGIMQALVSNITERKELERALRESEEQFRTFMETASDMMFITDNYGSFVYVNQAMVNMLGYDRQELIGMHIFDLHHKEAVDEVRKKHRELLEKGEDIHELVWEAKNRRKIFGEMKVVANYADDGSFRGLRGIFRDITERKKIEESQRLAQLGKLAADVAHEVNNPLTVISGNAEMALVEGGLSKKLEKALKIIVGQCEQATYITKRLLMFSKPSKGDFKEVDIVKSLDFVVSMVEHQFRSRKVKIIKEYGAFLPAVTIDEKQIQEVFMNLLRNAAEAMKDGGKITIATAGGDKEIKIDFSDTGEGISVEDMERIFDPFFTTKEKGTGLGLSVCYGIVKAHGGDLKYTSVPGEGTTATVTLPHSAG